MAAGRDISAPVRVTYFFGLESPGSRPDATEEALSAMGVAEVVVDEEISGDGRWHVAAFTTLRLTSEAIRESERQMTRLAVATGIRYHGWKVTLNMAEEGISRAEGRTRDLPLTSWLLDGYRTSRILVTGGFRSRSMSFHTPGSRPILACEWHDQKGLG